jgi:hypothetical protein
MVRILNAVRFEVVYIQIIVLCDMTSYRLNGGKWLLPSL